MPARYASSFRELVIDKDEGKCIDISSDEEYKKKVMNEDKNR